MRKILNNKLFTLIFSLFSLLILIPFFIIGNNTNYLVKKYIYYIIIILIICQLVVLVYSIIKIDKKVYKRKIFKFLMTIFIISFILCSTSIYLIYGNVKFKDWFVTTSIKTLSHQYLAKWFYNENQIIEIQSRNYVKENNMSTDVSLAFEKINSNEEIENLIADRSENELYKVIKFEVNECDAFMTVIYDPSKVKVAVTSKLGIEGENLQDISKNNNAIIAINGGGFDLTSEKSTGNYPLGITVVDGKIITDDEYEASKTGGLIGFNYDNKLVLIKNPTKEKILEENIRDGVTFGPFFIVNGVSAEVGGNGGWGNAPRTAIGQRADGIVLLLTIDGVSIRTHGAGLKDVLKIMEDYGAVNAANLDGGTSTALIINNELINTPLDNELRKLASSFIVVE